MLTAIEASKNCDLNSFIYAIGIPNVGERTARDLANKFRSFEKLRLAKASELTEVDDIGEITAENIVEFFSDENITSSIDRLLAKGISINNPQTNDKSDKLKDLSFVITGSIDGFSRDDIKELLEKNGASVRGSVSKNTDIVLAGEKAGSKKKKALELEIEIYEGEKLNKFLSELKGE